MTEYGLGQLMMTDAELTILSLVAESPRYGHDIQYAIDERGLREWMTIGFSSVYYILNKLERQNMVTSELRMENRGPARKLYTITEAGRGVLQTAVANLLRQPRTLGSGFELGLLNLHVLKPRQVYHVLKQHRDDLHRQIDLVEKSWLRHDNGDLQDPLRPLYTHSITMMKADLSWLDTFLADWQSRYPGVEEKSQLADEDDDAKAQTMINRRPTPDPAKMLQRLKRPPQPPEE